MSSGPKQALLAEFAVVARAIGHLHRLDILESLAQGERGVDALSEKIGISTANCSQHLQHLRRAGLVISRRDGKYVLYQLADDGIMDLIGQLYKFAERNVAAVNRILAGYFADRDTIEPVSRAEFIERSKAGEVILIDVRPYDEFAVGHVPGALNIPYKEIKERIGELKKDCEIIAYCRGPYCVFAFEAVAELRQHGFLARRLEDGFPQWKGTGLPVEVCTQ